jgi:hypothetical protein
MSNKSSKHRSDIVVHNAFILVVIWLAMTIPGYPKPYDALGIGIGLLASVVVIIVVFMTSMDISPDKPRDPSPEA